jgi:hypothetical protein
MTDHWTPAKLNPLFWFKAEDIPRCATCTHWNDDHRTNLPSDTMRQCQRLSDEDALGTGIFRVSGGEYSTRTGLTFGCILHEPQETTP